MSSGRYHTTVLFYPRHVALEKLEVGLPQGGVEFYMIESFRLIQFEM